MKNLSSQPGKRRKFIKQTLALLVTPSVFPYIVRGNSFNDRTDDPHGDGYQKSPLAPELIFEFVRAAHVDLNRVREMLEKEPMLVNATWDWGNGDFETALGGASHMGNHEIGKYLLKKNARKDIFYAAMAGEKGLVGSFIESDPSIVNVPGPHKFSLLYHVAISGNVQMAELLKPHLTGISTDCNRALLAAAREGHVPMSEWLLRNGVNNPSTVDVLGNTPLQIAEKRGHAEVVLLLKKYGAK